MNDFTKEELEEIKKCIEWFDENRVVGFHNQLCNKIQSMIDNYCEHEIEQNDDGKYWCKICKEYE